MSDVSGTCSRWQAFASTSVPAAVRWPAYAGALVFFLVILFVRGGPNPAETDAHAITYTTTAISHGQLRIAEQDTFVPNPPGYPLLTAPFVTVLRPWVGAPRWCDDKAIPAILDGPGAAFFRSLLSPCTGLGSVHHGRSLPHWYRSQAILTILGWMVLAAGSVALLRSAGVGEGVGELLLLGALAALPAASDTIAQSFHPQDLMSVGFACMAIAQVFKRRWIAVGVLFGVAFLCKQFAILPLLVVVVAAPGWGARLRTLVPAAGVVVLGLAPFYVTDPTDTVHALTAVYVAGAGIVKTPTMIGMLNVSPHLKLQIARDAPLLTAVALALWARWRARDRLLAPVPIVGLALACLATRLLFEVAILDYYFLAVGVFLLLLDFTLERPPLWSVGWIVAARYGLTAFAATAPPWVTASAFLTVSVVPLVLGLVQVPASTRPVLAAPGEPATQVI
jgi:hypothetical protein